LFQDSPTCLNFKNFEERRPSTGCPLIDLVPEERREGLLPMGTEEELETALRAWLERSIREMEA
jgi:hypothetical protein